MTKETKGSVPKWVSGLALAVVVVVIVALLISVPKVQIFGWRSLELHWHKPISHLDFADLDRARQTLTTILGGMAVLDECYKRRAILVIAKMDRLARNVAFIANLMNSDVEFVAVDMSTASRTEQAGRGRLWLLRVLAVSSQVRLRRPRRLSQPSQCLAVTSTHFS